jgi:hypothetical protein
LELIGMPLHCSSMYMGGALSCYDSSSSSMSNYSTWATAADDESTTRRQVPTRERPGRGDERTRRSATRWLRWCWAWGRTRRRAGSWPRRRTPTAQERRATEERLKIWGGGRGDDVALWDPRVEKENKETAGANCVCFGMKIGVDFLEYACLSIGTDHTNTVHLLVYCLP